MSFESIMQCRMSLSEVDEIVDHKRRAVAIHPDDGYTMVRGERRLKKTTKGCMVEGRT